jgi:hypothetical protein
VFAVSRQVAGAPTGRLVWEYSGAYGQSWITEPDGKKWINYLPKGKTILYLEESRTNDAVVLRSPESKLWIRLNKDFAELRRSADLPWKRWSAKGAWVSPGKLPPAAHDKTPLRKIRVVYLVPSDREPTANYVEKIQVVLGYVENLYQTSLRGYGFRLRGLPFEIERGKTVKVHLVKTDKPAEYYYGDGKPNSGSHLSRINEEILSRVNDPSRRVTLVFAETYHEGESDYFWPGHMAIATSVSPEGGLAVYSAWMLKDKFCKTTIKDQHALFFDKTPVKGRVSYSVKGNDSPRFEFVENGIGGVAHERAHALGLPHDRRDSARRIMGVGFRNISFNFERRPDPNKTVGFSKENAWLLMSSRYLMTRFNTIDFDPPTADLKLTRLPNGEINAELKMQDQLSSLSAVVLTYFDTSTSLMTGSQLKGKATTFKTTLPKPRDTVTEVRAYITDAGGNMLRVKEPLPGESQ